MSVIVKGMEMPKNCAYCPLSEYRNTSLGQILDCKRIGTVGTALRDTHDVLNRRHPNCPLIELPPHGRLIDADAIQDYNVETFGQRLLIIDTAPTVIEAEGET
jgi:hypothetical protein